MNEQGEARRPPSLENSKWLLKARNSRQDLLLAAPFLETQYASIQNLLETNYKSVSKARTPGEYKVLTDKRDELESTRKMIKSKLDSLRTLLKIVDRTNNQEETLNELEVEYLLYTVGALLRSNGFPTVLLD